MKINQDIMSTYVLLSNFMKIKKPGSKLLSITLHCGRYLGGRA
jgi:hypothetical protein